MPQPEETFMATLTKPGEFLRTFLGYQGIIGGRQDKDRAAYIQGRRG